MKKFTDFTRIYPLSKTLRFEAKPVGATLRNFVSNGLLERDEHRAQSYVSVKRLIDEYHKFFIDNALANGCLTYDDNGNVDSLKEYFDLYSTKKDETAQKRFKTIQQSLREQIVKRLTEGTAYKRLFGKELLNGSGKAEADIIHFINGADLTQLQGLSRDEAKSLVKEFQDFTTYFTGFYENRKNMYSAEEKSTGIAYRLINENLPKFIDNMDTFKKIVAIPEMQADIAQLYSDFEEYLNVTDIRDMFQLDYYNEMLTQKQIDVYNAIIGGKTQEGQDVKIKGLNEYINLYNQQHKDTKLPKLKVLFKQILSDRNAISWLPEAFHNDQEVLNAIKDCYERLTENVLGDNVLKNLLQSLSKYDANGIFLRNDLQLTDISQKMFGSWEVIQNAILTNIKSVAPAQKKKEEDEAYEKRISDIYKRADSFSIAYINSCLNAFIENNTYDIQSYFATLGEINTKSIQHDDLFTLIANAYANVKELVSTEYPEQKNLAQDKGNVAKVKLLLDSLKSLQHFVKPLLGKGDESDKDETFYGELSSLWAELDLVTPLYNMVRNYMTREPYSQEKIKLNFDNSQLLGGWGR